MNPLLKMAARGIALLLLLAGIALAVTYRAEIAPQAIRDNIAHNPFAPLIFIALQVLASLLFVPRTVLGIAAGLLFGLFWGTVWAIIGALAGAAAGFAFVRAMGAAGLLDASPGLGKIVEQAEHGGWRAVAIVRLTPLPHSLANTAMALTNVSWRDYLAGSFVGMLPMTLAQADIGASGRAIFDGRGGWVIACLMLAAGLGLTLLLKRAAPRN